MFKNDFQELQRQIKPNDALIEQTKQKMRQALREDKPKNSFKIVYRITATAACIMFVAVTGYNWNQTNNVALKMAQNNAKYNSSIDYITSDIILPDATLSSKENKITATEPESNQAPTSSEGNATKGEVNSTTEETTPNVESNSTSEIVTSSTPETHGNTSSEVTTPPATGVSPSTQETTSKSTHETASKSTQETTSKSTQETTSKSTQETASKSTQETASKSTQETASKSTHETGSKPSSESAPQIANQANPKGLQTAAPPPQKQILTKLDSGVHSSSVRLNNGTLNFVTPEVTFVKPFMLCPFQGNLTPWSQEQYFKYLGKDPRPATIPNDLTLMNLDPKNMLNVTINKDGTLTNDNFTFRYAAKPDKKETVQRQLKITTGKGKYPKSELLFYYNKEEASQMKDTPVNVGYRQVITYDAKNEPNKPYDVYFAQFIYNGIGYYVETQSLTQEEFINVLLSIIK